VLGREVQENVAVILRGADDVVPTVPGLVSDTVVPRKSSGEIVPLRERVTSSSIFYHNWFRHLGWDPLAYRYREPGDWNRLRKFAFLGARSLRHPAVLLSHYRERNQKTSGG